MQDTQVKRRESDLRLILVISVVFTLSQIITFFRVYARNKMDGLPIVLEDMLTERLLSWIIGFVFLVAIVKTTRRFLLEKRSWVLTITIHMFIAAVFSFLWYSTYIFAMKLVTPPGGEEFIYYDLVYWFLLNFDKLFLMYLSTTIITYAYYYLQRDRDNKINQSRMANQLLEARLKMLKSQLHPHFLFNTLNSITSLMDLDIKKAKSMTVDLADLLRHVLAHKDNQLIDLDEEIEILSKYIDIEKTRFSDDLEVNMHMEGDFQGVQLPSLLLQPLVENSIKHGFSRRHPSIKVDIYIKRLENCLQITIQDNGHGFTSEEAAAVFEKGTGIQNTKQRLQSIYGDQHIFSVTSGEAGGVNNYIEIPVVLTTNRKRSSESAVREVLTP
ncbi:MAG: histidine kinase [Saprospiraceae bacterium]|nr:histidine kinase [Lewinella sp.]